MSFTPAEREYLMSHPIARLATLGPEGQPDVEPITIELDGDGPGLWICTAGGSALRTRKYRNITGGRRKVALVVDDIPSFDPFVARGIRIYGRADDPVERVGMVGPGRYAYVRPMTSWTWNLAGEPAGDEWYATERRGH